MKKRKRLTISLIAAAIATIIIAGILIFFLCCASTPKSVARKFHDSLLPEYDAQGIEQCVGAQVYSIRFDDEGYFLDRYERARDQIVYYYGASFNSEISDITVTDASEAEISSITREYKTKYSLMVDEVKIVSFTVTLSSHKDSKARSQSLTVLKIDGEWLVYDYDAYWFAYM